MTGQGLSLPERIKEQAAGFMRAWVKREYAPRTACSECHFESSEGYPSSHAPGCSQEVDHG